LAQPETIRIEIRDTRGALVRTLQERALSQGLHTVEWNGRDTQGASAASGVYLITLETGDVRETVEAMLVR
jgi:flagellar hook assembly protein FlgD